MDLVKRFIEFFRSTLGKIVGVGLTLSLVMAIIQLTPDEWTKNLGVWVNFVRSIDTNLLWLGFVALLFVGFYQINSQDKIARTHGAATVPNTGADSSDSPKWDTLELLSYSKEEFGTMLRALIEHGAEELRVFAYTAETLRDYVTYADRYRHLSIKILVRDWVTEKHEEDLFNLEYARRDPSLRPWRKWKKIRSMAHEFDDEMKSDLAYRVQVRFFSEPPIFKGIIVGNSYDKSIEAFLGLYEWQERPQKGGSPYKGEGGSVLHLSSGKSERERIMLERFVSHFDRLWLTQGRTFEQVLSSETFINETNSNYNS